MKFDEIKSLIEILQDTDITELHIEKEGEKLKIKREKYLSTFEVMHDAPGPAAEVKETKGEVPADENLLTITSPIVGIFHRAPSPESPPYIEAGTSVRKGQVLCIVEAMKLMNEIESDTDGVIADILIENGQPVEYGEALFRVKPA